jgi:hypothetical protein
MECNIVVCMECNIVVNDLIISPIYRWSMRALYLHITIVLFILKQEQENNDLGSNDLGSNDLNHL